MIQTNTAYMSDPARAERTVRRFMKLTLREMKQMQTQNYVDYIMDKIAPAEDLSPETLEDMTYIELASLIAQVGGAACYDGYDYDSWSLQQSCYCYLAYILTDGKRRSITVRLFLALPLKAFYTCLESLFADGRMYEKFNYIRARCSYEDGYTIGDFLAEKLKKLSKAWLPIVPLDSYEDSVRAALGGIGRLLVDSFEAAFNPNDITTGKESFYYG